MSRATFTFQDGQRIARAVRNVEAGLGLTPSRRVPGQSRRRVMHEAFMAEIIDAQPTVANPLVYEFAWEEVQWQGAVLGWVAMSNGRSSTESGNIWARAAIATLAGCAENLVGQVVPMEQGVDASTAGGEVIQMTFAPPSAPFSATVGAVNGTPPNVTYDVLVVGQTVQQAQLQALTPADRRFSGVSYTPRLVGDVVLVLADAAGGPVLWAMEQVATTACP